MDMENSEDRERQNKGQRITRREFVRRVGIGGSALFLFSRFGAHAAAWAGSEKPVLKMVLVDYGKCTGCRTCETVCSSHNKSVIINGESMPGLGNPYYSNIRIETFNPDVDIPNVCAMCADTPCVNACPVDPDPKTGKRALYRDELTHTIRNDSSRCTGCGSCAEACGTQRTGVITPNSQTGKPERLCTLCDGDPQCIKHCPFEALAYVEVRSDGKLYGLAPEKIASELANNWYGTADFGGPL
jgi:anaerobic carbon-monoxide dehydrogenase iron sulfur subunit